MRERDDSRRRVTSSTRLCYPLVVDIINSRDLLRRIFILFVRAAIFSYGYPVSDNNRYRAFCQIVILLLLLFDYCNIVVRRAYICAEVPTTRIDTIKYWTNTDTFDRHTHQYNNINVTKIKDNRER